MEIGKNIYYNLKEMYKKPNKKFSIAFMPYKEDMFDCMDTIYEEASKDPECAPVVIPIPYYNMKNGIPTELVLEFDEYEFKNNFTKKLNSKYDVIVFHYPYDGQNLITRPLIYTNVMKFFCSNLVYIPYFVPYSHPISKSLIDLSGVRNADLIIVDSEETKQDYLDVVEEDKIKVWGSPKYDHIDKNYPYPKWWKKIIKDNRVILLNNTIVAFCKAPQASLNALNDIFDQYEDKGGVSLIWRPHPLFETLINNCSESFRTQYNDLLDRAYSSNNIIVDKSKDMWGAINLSDEMISEPSSLVTLYKKTNKPITIIGEKNE